MFQKQIFCAVGFFLFFAVSYAAQGISVSARSAVVMEMETGAALFEKNPDERLPMASTTKIMTAICAIENKNPGDVITITEEMTNVEGSSIYLKAGERFTLEELLYGLMLESGNDAAVAIAIAVSGDESSFVNLMNQTAKRLGLVNTAFQNPSGLPAEGHYTTARELAVLSAYACKNELFSRIVATKSKTIGHFEGTGVRYLANHNRMLKTYKGADGVKTGYTKQAGRCLVTSAAREGMRLICVTLNAPDDWRDHTNLLNDCFARFAPIELVKPYSIQRAVPVVGGVSSFVPLVNLERIFMVMEKKAAEEAKVEIRCPHFFYAPVKKGDVAGTAHVLRNGAEIAQVPLVAGIDVEAAAHRGILSKLAGFVKNAILKWID